VTGAFLAMLGAATLVGRMAAPSIGQTVPDFTATALDGTVVSLHDSLDTHPVVVVVFLSTFCPYARSNARHLGTLAEEYRSRGVLFVGVNSNQSETAEEMRAFALAHGYAFPVIADPESKIADRLGASCSPEAYLVDRERRLRYHGWVQSKLRSPDLERALEAVVAGKPVRRAATRAFGCSIDRPRAAVSSR
jgi:peroxiredoxin